MFVVQLINGLIRGTPVQVHPKIELFPGQIVKGTILKAFPGETVQVRIGGTSLFARLRAPLAVGQEALFQVILGGNPLTLKVVGIVEEKGGKTSQAEGDLQALEGLLRGLGFKPDRRVLQGLKMLMDSGIPLKEGDLPLIANLLKEAEDPGRIVQAIRLASARQLPIRPLVIRSLETFLFGPSLSVILENITSLEKDPALKGVLRERLMSLMEALRAAFPSDEGNALMSAFGRDAGGSEGEGGPIQRAEGRIGREADRMQRVDGRIRPDVDRLRRDNGRVPQEDGRNRQDMVRSQQGSRMGGMQTGTPLPAGSETEPFLQALPELEGLAAEGSGKGVQEAGASPLLLDRKAGANAPLLRLFLQLLGIGHEAKLLARPERKFAEGDFAGLEFDNLKRVLLEIRKTDALSKEAAEWVEKGIRWITGQQLLLSSPPESLWNQFLLQIPLSHRASFGEQAFVQLEGRKDGKGNIDPENCRLYFCLHLHGLGETRIDVRIVNRLMSIQIYNDLPWVKEWMETHKAEWRKPMEEMGYALSSLKVLPLSQEQPNRPSALAFSSYREVDIRI